MDRNMITVMSGQAVDFFDRDFRELYAVSEKLNLYKEFHISPPAANVTATLRSKVGPKRPSLPATTSRFQVTLGDSPRPDIQVPAHKFYNPKYSLVVGDIPRPYGSHQELGSKRKSVRGDVEALVPQQTSSDKMDRLNAFLSEVPTEPNSTPNKATPEKKGWATWKKKFSKRKSPSKNSLSSLAESVCPVPQPAKTDEEEDSFEVLVLSPSKLRGKKPSTAGRRTESKQTISTSPDIESKSK